MTRKIFVPGKHQQEIITYERDHKRLAIWAGMGMGKTSSTLNAINHLQLHEESLTLVLAPLRVAQSTWPDEALKWENLRDIEVSAVVGDPKQRAAALKKPANVFTTNYENLPWLIEHLGKKKWPFKNIVADESTKLKSFRLRQGGKRAAALAKVAHDHSDRFIELTGTPSPNGLVDLWGQVWFLDRGLRLGRTYTGFEERWFRPDFGDFNSVKPFAHSQKEIQDKVKDICFSLDAKDYFDIDEPIKTSVMVDMPAKARAIYEKMKKEAFIEIMENEVEAFNAASKTMKLVQLVNGSIYVDEEHNWIETHDAKLQALESIAEEAAGMPLLVAYHFKSDLARLKKAFPKGRELDKDPQTIKDWNAGKIPMLFAHPMSAGHGLNLQDGSNIVVFFSLWWNLEEHLQIIERVGPMRQKQSGHNRAVFIYYIRVRDSIDDLLMERIETKRRVQDILLDATKNLFGA